MEPRLSYLYSRAQRLAEELDAIEAPSERLAGTSAYRQTTVQQVQRFLREVPALAVQPFSERELAEMIADRCVEAGSFLFALGAPGALWRAWCSVAGMLFHHVGDAAYSLQLLALARAITESSVTEQLREAELGSYRHEAIRAVVLRPLGAPTPSSAPQQEPDDDYGALLAALESDDDHALRGAIARIASFWLSEAEYGDFEPGIFPAFEPELTAVVASLAAQGRPMIFRDPSVRRFLEAALA